MKVIDTTVIAAYILKEPGWEKLADLLMHAVTVDMAVKESLNAIWKTYARGHISEESAKAKAKALLELAESGLEIVDEKTLFKRAFEIACSENLSLYDALFLTLAESRDATLYTLDEEQAKKARKLAIRVKVIE
ncbi:MAG: type II toxin-antitoxin system VapC family toxin [Thermoproteota archaeon]|nr:type II toxin-antitoxin system VapC family toxin [Candidatus Brockarchaeota archaeon]